MDPERKRKTDGPGQAALPVDRLGGYQLIERIGAGGMGEVYRARDLKLGRDVAIKVLPPAFTADPERLARFEREARMLAALNHPNIATIHGFEESVPSADSGSSVRGLVMELVEGETLAERIVRTPAGLPIDEALGIARQIAEALEAAHAKGIVHRDLKPANIKITPAGTVKVLDFGLAKVTAAGDADPQAPTMTVEQTREGVIAGTPAYMSPEQARGLPVDRRSDIWAFGCVLYAMLAGRAAFTGGTVADTLAAVLFREPDWTSLPAGLTDGLSQLLVRALAKDPQQRLRDIGDAKLEIDAALADRSERTRRVNQSPRARRAWLGPAIAGALVIAIAGGIAWRGMTARPGSIPAIGPLARVTFDGGLTTEPSISADGRLIAYASNRGGEGNLDIWIQQATGGSAIRLTNDPADDREPSLSPDGSLVAFRSERTPRGIYVMPALGGDARLIAANGMVPRFSPDGRSIAFWSGNWLAPRGVGQIRRTYVVPTSGGEPTEVGRSLASVGDPAWSPDGTSLLVFGRRTTSGEGTEPDWWNVPLNGGPVAATGVYQRLAASGLEVNDTDLYPYPFAWTRSGALFAAADSGSGGTGEGDTFSIFSIALESDTGRVAGDPVRLTTGTTFDTWPAVSRDGRMVFAVAPNPEFMFTLPLDANAGRVTGPIRRIREGTSVTGRPGVSEDGRLLVFPRYEFGAGGVWLRDMNSGQERQLAATPRTPLNPVISVDGRWVAYTVTAVEQGGNAGPGIGYVVETAGGAPRQVCENCEIYQWSRDNRQIFIVETGARVIRLDLATGSRTVVLAASAAAGDVDVNGGQIDRPLLSPNQRWIVFNSRRKVYVAPLYSDRETPTREWILVHSGAGAERQAGLSPDGGLLYLLLERDGFRCLYAMRVDRTTGRPQGEPFLVHHFHDASLRWGSTGFGSATVTGMFVAYLHQLTGNIWSATIDTGR